MREEARERWQAMSPKEREAHRQAMRERWEQMTPEERKAHQDFMRSMPAGEGKDKAKGKGGG
jgi:hypothetical protein